MFSSEILNVPSDECQIVRILDKIEIIFKETIRYARYPSYFISTNLILFDLSKYQKVIMYLIEGKNKEELWMNYCVIVLRISILLRLDQIRTDNDDLLVRTKTEESWVVQHQIRISYYYNTMRIDLIALWGEFLLHWLPRISQILKGKVIKTTHKILDNCFFCCCILNIFILFELVLTAIEAIECVSVVREVSILAV